MEYTFTKENFAQDVLQSDRPVLVDFYADWCGPCKMISPIVDRLADKYADQLKVGKVNVDEQQELALQYHVMSIPYLAFFKGGELVGEIVGAVPETQLEDAVQKALAK